LMNYTTEQAELLQDLFRHKLVHLAQPKPVINDGSRCISWSLHHENPEKHLQLERLTEKEKITVTSMLTIECDHVFHIGVLDLVKDIRASVEKPTGYLASLEISADLQNRFERAIFEIYDYM